MAITQQSFLSLGPAGFHRIAYTDSGDAASRHAVLCVHGLSRNNRDFDRLAAALAGDCRVVCMDVVGRRGVPVHRDPEPPIGPEFLRGIDLWRVWQEVRCPVLELRGAESAVLTAEVVAEMRRRKPELKVVEFPGVGHAPALADPEQIGAVRDFLLAPKGRGSGRLSRVAPRRKEALVSPSRQSRLLPIRFETDAASFSAAPGDRDPARAARAPRVPSGWPR